MPPRDVRNVLTPDALIMVQTIASTGSFAAAARELGLVPSALTYRVRQLEDALDVLLFDRSARHAVMTEAGQALLAESSRLLTELNAIANRVRRVATGWEPQLTIAVDGVIRTQAFLDVCAQFYALDAPSHPLAQLPTPIADADLVRHRAIVVADSGEAGQRMSVGLLSGQPTFTVSSLSAKLQAMVQGLGGGFIPEWLAAPAIAQGQLVQLPVARRERVVRLCVAWRHSHTRAMGKALQWWLAQVQRPITRAALIGVSVDALGPLSSSDAGESPNRANLAPELPLLQRNAKRGPDAAP